MRLFLSIIWLVLSISCKTDESAVNEFNDCLTLEQRQSLQNLEDLSDQFIRLNYPNKGQREGYKLFLEDLVENERTFELIDSAQVLETVHRLKNAFGEHYDEDRANFLPWSALNGCLKLASNGRYIDKIVNDKMSAGEIGPRIVGSYLYVNKIDTSMGLTKVIFHTEVVFRILFFEVRR